MPTLVTIFIFWCFRNIRNLFVFSSINIQNYNLPCVHNIHSVIWSFIQWTPQNEIYLSKQRKLLPLLCWRIFIMQDYNWRDFFTIVSSQWHDKMSDIFNHSTDNDVVLSQHGIFHWLEFNIIFGCWLIDYLTLKPISFDVTCINFLAIIIVKLVEISSNLLSFTLINNLKLSFFFFFIGIFSENFFCFF